MCLHRKAVSKVGLLWEKYLMSSFVGKEECVMRETG